MQRNRFGVLVAITAAAVIGSASLLGMSSTTVVPAGSRVVAALPHWDSESALDSLQDQSQDIDVAAAFVYSVGADGSVVPEPSSEHAVNRIDEIRTQADHLQVVPSVANTTAGRWDRTTVARILRDPSLRAAHIDSLTTLTASDAFSGVQIDYEDLHTDDRELFSSFVSDLAVRIREIGKVLYVTVHPKEDDAGYDTRNLAQDYAAIGRSADKVVVMAYDRHWENSPSGPIAPYDWVNSVVQYATEQIPREKLLLGIPLYGYDWTGASGTPLTWKEAVELSITYSATPVWDPVSRSNRFTYRTGDVTHEVWFEDARSIAPKIAVAQHYLLDGIALWRLGGEDPEIWDVVS